jgi:2-succinyl-6-hydroxy-2,4-cyclohexadiene-1-carboxylate synthase
VRREADERLARELEDGAFEEFVARWRAQPLFADETERARELAVADQLRNEPSALAAVLRGLGAAEMEPLWGRLAELKMPATVLVGDRDERFLGYARRMVDLLGDAKLVRASGGHGLPLENPEAVAREITALAGRRFQTAS